jgi:ABC-type multidrug transport system ATPase subunit
MLSSGTRRKLGLVEAVASGAGLTLLDGPFAALDAPSRRWLVDLLDAAARQCSRAWVVADHAWPPGLADDAGIAVVDLGDGLD